MNSTVYVYNRDRKPVKHKRVAISISGGGMADGVTDDSGCATISHSSESTAKVYVNGTEVGRFHAPGSTEVTV
ncbi:hypothetical protein [uncultured Thiodictyon sp.]|uniref:hypothetical protein n=1 Tax=uncultured Thiodictyon sp. TaxID=1846217 RepID=UPI0025F3760E|nr:hypothetical protein [uncultured Thiodictyon sp.]